MTVTGDVERRTLPESAGRRAARFRRPMARGARARDEGSARGGADLEPPRFARRDATAQPPRPQHRRPSTAAGESGVRACRERRERAHQAAAHAIDLGRRPAAPPGPGETPCCAGMRRQAALPEMTSPRSVASTGKVGKKPVKIDPSVTSSRPGLLRPRRTTTRLAAYEHDRRPRPCCNWTPSSSRSRR